MAGRIKIFRSFKLATSQPCPVCVLFHVFKTFVTSAATEQISSSDMAPLTSEELAAIEDEEVLNKMVSR